MFDGWRLFLGTGCFCATAGRHDELGTAGHSWAGASRGFQLLPWRLWDATATPFPGSRSVSLLPPPPSWNNDSFSILIPVSCFSCFPLECSRVLLFLLVLLGSVLKSRHVTEHWEFCCSLQRGARAFSPFVRPVPLPLPHKHLGVLIPYKSLAAQLSRVTPASGTRGGNRA